MLNFENKLMVKIMQWVFECVKILEKSFSSIIILLLIISCCGLLLEILVKLLFPIIKHKLSVFIHTCFNLFMLHMYKKVFRESKNKINTRYGYWVNIIFVFGSGTSKIKYTLRNYIERIDLKGQYGFLT